MFSNTVVCTDKFYNLPLGAQALYLQLGMAADDDGFVSSPRTTMRIIGCSQEDLEALIVNGYIIPFDSGIIVVSDWLKNNTIQKDRYTPTENINEFRTLEIENKRYSLKVETKCKQNVSTDKDRLDKDRLDKDRLGEGRLDEGTQNVYKMETNCIQNGNTDNSVKVDPKQILIMYNKICLSLPRAVMLSDERKKVMEARLNTYSIADFERLFTIAEESSFLTGLNERGWRANLDWLIDEGNMAKVLDGNYQDNLAYL
jgi:hypothetical protein